MKLKNFDWNPPSGRPAWEPKPLAVVTHRRRGRVVLEHGSDETCDLCQAAEKTARNAEQQLFSYPTRPWRQDGGDNAENLPSQRPRTLHSHRLLRSQFLDEVIAMPASVEAAMKKQGE